MKTFRATPNRVNASRKTHLIADFDGTDHNIIVKIEARDIGGNNIGLERYIIGETEDDDHLGTGPGSILEDLKAIMVRIQARADIEAKP